MKQLLILLMLSLSLVSCINVDLGGLLSPELTENTITVEPKAKSKILIVDVSGFIKNGESSSLFANYCTPESIKKVLNKAEMDPAIKAVILRINSPGGGVTASDLIHHEIKAFKKRTGIPVYANTLSLAASGGYYIACASDGIYATPSSMIGSIGVIARFPDLSKLANKIGYDEKIFQSSKNKSMGHPLKEMTAEQKAIFQKMIDDMYDRFLEIVVDGRATFDNKEALKPIADGRVYTARESKNNGLIDGIMYLNEMVEMIKEKQSLKAVKLVIYNYGTDENSTIYSKMKPEINIINFDIEKVLGPMQSGLHYLWMPGKAE